MAFSTEGKIPSYENGLKNKRAPCKKPPFTIGEIKKAIPPHCFRRSVIQSFYYVISDLAIAYLFYYISTTYIPFLPDHKLFHLLAWLLYWIFQGCILTGVWVIAHECGHNAFSNHQWLDDTVGLILYSALLVPYFSFKYSHRRHHSHTNSLERDEVYVPKLKDNLGWYPKFFNNPPGRVFTLLVQLTLGWPLYLMFNVSGRAYDRFACHYDPNSPIFKARERLQIFISDAGVLVMFYGLYLLAGSKGLAWVFCVYGGPLVAVNAIIVLITYLQHTHPSLPHYDSSEWDWLRGALATVDRDYGMLNKVVHNITDSHVVHHLFARMPHYHAVEATKAIKPILGDYYQFDGTPILKALWREAKECMYVESEGGDQNKGVFWYKNKV